jgi:multiple sugar transport system substrate-binding protein
VTRLAVATMAGSLLLSACTGGEDAPEPGPSPQPSSAGPERSELRLTVFGSPAQQQSYEDVARGYERVDPDVDVVTTGYRTARAAMRAVETGEQPADVFLMDGNLLAELTTRAPDLLQPLDALLEERDVQFGDDHQRVALSALSAEAALQCMPAEMSPAVVYANDELLPSRARLRSLGVELPRAVETWGWNEFAATARAVAVADGPEGMRGVYLPATLELVTAFVRGAGADVVDDVAEPRELDLTSDEALQVLRLVAVLAADRSVSLTPEQDAEKSARDRFVDGELGLFVGDRADVPVLRDAGVDFQVLPLPGFGRSRSVSSVSGYCVPSASDRVDLAADFIAWAVSQEGAATAARRGALVPARLDTLSSEAFTQPRRLPSNYRVYADGVRRSEPLPDTPLWTPLNRRADRVLQEVLTDPTLDLGEALPLRMEALARQTERLLAPEETEETDAPDDTGTDEPSASPTDG